MERCSSPRFLSRGWLAVLAFVKVASGCGYLCFIPLTDRAPVERRRGEIEI